jgi:membrane fusion protein, multidrug efflux system
VALSDGGAITQQQLEGLQLNEKAAKAKYLVSKKRVDDALIKSPIAGYINKLFLKEGGMIGPAVPVCELINTKALKMTVKVDERDVVKIMPGRKVEIEAVALPGTLLSGRVLSTAAKADYALQYGVEIMIDENPGEKLKAGMVATAAFVFTDETTGPLIPAQCTGRKHQRSEGLCGAGQSCHAPINPNFAFQRSENKGAFGIVCR